MNRTLIDLVSDGLTNIFDSTDLTEIFADLHTTSEAVWRMFIRKNKTRYVYLLDEDETNINVIETELRTAVQDVCDTNFYKYTTLLNTLNLAYNPIENYRMSETTTTETTTATETATTSTTESTDTATASGVHANDIFTFENTQKQTDENTTENETTGNSTGTNTGTSTGEQTANTEQTLTRAGNIGVTTSQQMIESERDLAEFNFINNIFLVDVAKYLLLSIY